MPVAATDRSSTASPATSHATDPGDAPLETSVLADLAKANLVKALNAISGAKTLVLDPTLAGPLALVTEVALLKHQAVDKMFWLEPGPLTASTKNIVWMCRPRIAWMKLIASQIKAHAALSPHPSYTYTLLLVPRATQLCRSVLESEGVLGDVTISEYSFEFIPLEQDVLSLELDHAAREIFLEKDETSVFYSAQALHLLQRAFGVIPRLVGKGDAAKRLCKQLIELRETETSPDGTPLQLSTQIDAAVILDRSVDWVTPMLTQLTYEGLLDETMGIKNSHVEVSPDLLSNNAPTPPVAAVSGTSATTAAAAAPKKKKHPLNSQDAVFRELRDLNFQSVPPKLNKIAKRIKGAYAEGREGKDIAQMKAFVGSLGGLQNEHQALKLHTGLAEEISTIVRTEEFLKPLAIQQNLVSGEDLSKQLTAIEDLMTQGQPMHIVLRLLVLLSIVGGGIKPKSFDGLRREFLQTYGYEHLPLLLSLTSLNLFYKSPSTSSVSLTSKSPFPSLRKALRLYVDDDDGSPDDDISFVYSGYAPLSVRLVQCVAQKAAVLSAPVSSSVSGGGAGGDRDSVAATTTVPRAHPIVGWKGFEDILNILPGATFDEIQRIDGGVSSSTATSAAAANRLPKDHVSTTLVFFLGGCTFTEIAALRKMREGSKGRRFLVCTTSIISGTSLLESLEGDRPVSLLEV